MDVYLGLAVTTVGCDRIRRLWLLVEDLCFSDVISPGVCQQQARSFPGWILCLCILGNYYYYYH